MRRKRFQGVISCLRIFREREVGSPLALPKEADPILQKERDPLSVSLSPLTYHSLLFLPCFFFWALSFTFFSLRVSEWMTEWVGGFWGSHQIKAFTVILSWSLIKQLLFFSLQFFPYPSLSLFHFLFFISLFLCSSLQLLQPCNTATVWVWCVAETHREIERERESYNKEQRLVPHLRGCVLVKFQ